MAEREPISTNEIEKKLAYMRRDNRPAEIRDKLYYNLAVPSYVHGYSLAIEYMYNWFESKFDSNYFKGGIYVDGKHVLDDYKHFSKNVVKGQNPRARIAPTVEFDYDREGLDSYLAPPDLYLRRTDFNESFFKDHTNKLYLGMTMRALRMNFNNKVRVNTRSQQLDIYKKMELAFRIGSTQSENISVDFHIPKFIMLDIAEKSGFKVCNGEIINIIDFLNYFNQHSDLPCIFKIRAINQKAEFFIRLNGLYTHIDTRDKLQLDDGERDGKLDFNFHVEINCVLTIPIPHFFAYYAASDIYSSVPYIEKNKDTVAIYSINPFEVAKSDEHGWNLAAVTEYQAEDGDTEMDLSSIFTGDNILTQAIQHDLTRGVSPYKFINIKVYRCNDLAIGCPIKMDWNSNIAYFETPEITEKLVIAIYYDRIYINNLDIELNNYNSSRIESSRYDIRESNNEN